MSLFDELDELASAYLDGETTAEETARVEADADLMERVEELRILSEAVAQPVTPPSAQARESAIAAALAASSTAPNVSSLGAHAATRVDTPARQAKAQATAATANRWERFSKVGTLVAAAAAGIVVIGLAINNVGSGGQDTATASMDSAAEVTEEASSDSVSIAGATDASGDPVDAATAAMEAEPSVAESMAADAMEDAMDEDAMTDAPEEFSEDDAMEEAMEEETIEEAMEQEAMEDTAAAATGVGPDAEADFADRSDMALYVGQLDTTFNIEFGTFTNLSDLTAAITERDLRLTIPVTPDAPLPCPDTIATTIAEISGEAAEELASVLGTATVVDTPLIIVQTGGPTEEVLLFFTTDDCTLIDIRTLTP